MSELLLPIIALAFAAALQPLQVIALLALLQTGRGIHNGLAYIGGMTSFRLALALVFWWLVSGVETAVESQGGDFGVITGTVMIILGLLLMIFALRQVFSAQSDDQAAASWLDKLDSVTPPRAALVGVAFLALDPKDWLIDISAIDLIASADLNSLQSGIAYLVYIFLAQSLLVTPLITTLFFPAKAHSYLGKLSTWLKMHENKIEILVALVFGLLFLFVGIEYFGVLS